MSLLVFAGIGTALGIIAWYVLRQTPTATVPKAAAINDAQVLAGPTMDKVQLVNDAWEFYVESRDILGDLMKSSGPALTAHNTGSAHAMARWHTFFQTKGVPLIKRFASVGFRDSELDQYLANPELIRKPVSIRDVSFRVQQLLVRMSSAYNIPPKGLFIKAGEMPVTANENTVTGGRWR
jgi:hypothetical protein